VLGGCAATGDATGGSSAPALSEGFRFLVRLRRFLGASALDSSSLATTAFGASSGAFGAFVGLLTLLACNMGATAAIGGVGLLGLSAAGCAG